MSLAVKHFAFCALAITIFGSIGSVTVADGKNKRSPMDPRGEPSGHLKKGTEECFKVWHNPDGWHVRVVNGKGSREHRYQGTITVEGGVIENMSSHFAKRNGQENQWKHGAKKNEISFDFATKEKEDGINFKASKTATAIRFSLKIDGQSVPDRICIGNRGDHPESTTFALDAHPGDHREEKEAKQNARGATKK